MLISVHIKSVDDICSLNRIMRLPIYENLNFDIGTDKNRMLDGKSLACCMILSARTMCVQIIGDEALSNQFLEDLKCKNIAFTTED